MASAAHVPRLPGIHFETVRPPSAPALPRMDVTAFAGFAATGPVGEPVAVEDVVAYHEVFGGDLPLAWDPREGEMAHACLPDAVHAFFRNGGRRCWVLRLAREPERGWFRLPGLLRAGDAEVTGAAWAVASSPGSWTDAVRINATLLRRGLPDGAVGMESGTAEPGVRLTGVGERDMLRLELSDGTVGFFPPRRPVTATDSTPEERAVVERRPASRSFWFRPALPNVLPRRPGASLSLLSGAEIRPLTLRAWTSGEVARFRVSADEVRDVAPGAWLRLALPVRPSSRFRPEVYLIVDEVDRGDPRSTLIARRGWWALVRERAWGRAATRPFRASLVSTELWARRAGEATARIADVGLDPASERWLGLFPDDATLYRPPAPTDPPAPAVWTELSRPRFPLAAPPDARAAAEALLPLGLEVLPRETYDQPALHSGRSALERDGLAALSPSLFLDRALGTVPTDRLLSEAFQLQYGEGETRRLGGVHALLHVEEASIIAVPDAVQPGWVRRDGGTRKPPRPPAPPTIRSAARSEDGRTVAVSWTRRSRATSYTLEYGPDPRFRSASQRLVTNLRSARIDPGEACRDRLYLRVLARTPAGSTAWSGTWLVDVAADAFDRCGRAPLHAPRLRRREIRGRLRLRWSGPGTRYRLERAAEPTFASPEVVYEGPLRRFDLWLPTDAAYFRVAAATAEEESPWSTTRAWVPSLAARWEVVVPERSGPDERLLDVHTALLRLCAARSDMVALLALPSPYRTAQALAHVDALRSRLGTGSAESGDAGGRVLSFGALYHPWTVGPTAAAGPRVRAVPPEGALCGVLAARSLGAGAWAVPANRALAGVVALRPGLGDVARAAFFGRGANAVTPSPDGFMVLSEETLSDDAELTGLGVRRLLILLRRLALREGDRYVFQPNDDAFQRLVQRQFDGLLADLFARGAFAGQRPEDGYRVVADAAVNPAGSVERGRLVVELRVAPSRPLHFLTVRLVQTSAGLSVVEA